MFQYRSDLPQVKRNLISNISNLVHKLSGKLSNDLKNYRIFNPLMTNVPYHVETSHLICIANHLTGFYMMGNIGG